MKLRGHPRFYELLDEMRRLHDAKAADYSPDEPLENLRVSAEWAGIEPWRGVLVRMGDKWMRLVNLCRRGGQHEVPDETVKDTALDLANYSLLFIVLWEHRKAPERPAGHIHDMKPGSFAKILYCLQLMPGRLVWPGTGQEVRKWQRNMCIASV